MNDNEKPWKPDWVSIVVWAVMIVGAMAIWIGVIRRIVSFF